MPWGARWGSSGVDQEAEGGGKRVRAFIVVSMRRNRRGRASRLRLKGSFWLLGGLLAGRT